MKHFRPFIAAVILSILSTTSPIAQESSCDTSLISYCGLGSETLIGPCGTWPITYITRVRLGDINNETECAAYSCFTDISSVVEAGKSYSLNVHVTSSSVVPGYCLSIKYYVDWNEDGDFDDPDEGLWGDRNGGPPPYSWSVDVAVPDEVAPGEKRMRIRVFEECVLPIDPDACDSEYIGETEDYTLVVSDPLSSVQFTSEESGPQIIVYPNPAANHISISGLHSKAAGELILYALDGAIVYRRKGLLSEQASFDISNINAGIYVAEFHIDGKIGRQKLMVGR